MDKFWLKSYQAGVPAEIDPTQYRSLTHLLEESFRKYADRNAFACMDKSITYARTRSHVAADGRLAAERAACSRARAWRSCCRTCCSIRWRWPAILRAGYTIVNVNPLVHAARTAAPAEGLRRRSHRRAGKLRAHGRSRSSRTRRSSTSSSATWATCWASSRAPSSTSSCARSRRWCRPGRCRARCRFKTRAGRGRAPDAQAGQLGHDDIAFLQYTGGTTGVVERRGAAAP